MDTGLFPGLTTSPELHELQQSFVTDSESSSLGEPPGEVATTSAEILQLLGQCSNVNDVFGDIHVDNLTYANSSLHGSCSELSDIFGDSESESEINFQKEKPKVHHKLDHVLKFIGKSRKEDRNLTNRSETKSTVKQTIHQNNTQTDNKTVSNASSTKKSVRFRRRNSIFVNLDENDENLISKEKPTTQRSCKRKNKVFSEYCGNIKVEEVYSRNSNKKHKPCTVLNSSPECSQIKTPEKFECSKCDLVFKTLKQFKLHKQLSHNRQLNWRSRVRQRHSKSVTPTHRIKNTDIIIRNSTSLKHNDLEENTDITKPGNILMEALKTARFETIESICLSPHLLNGPDKNNGSASLLNESHENNASNFLNEPFENNGSTVESSEESHRVRLRRNTGKFFKNLIELSFFPKQKKNCV